MKSAEPRQLAFVFADSPQGDKARGSQDESSGKRFLVHTAKGSGWMEPATCTAVERRLMESVASACNLAQALLNVLRNKGAPGIDGRSVEQVVDEAPALLPELQKSLLDGTYQPGDVRRVWKSPSREAASAAWHSDGDFIRHAPPMALRM